MRVKNRRSFFKNAGVLAASPWLGGLVPAANAEQAPALAQYRATAKGPDVVVENKEMRLVIGGDGRARSLVHKATKQECLDPRDDVPMWTVTQYLVEDNEWQQSLPARDTDFPVESVHRDGDNLIVDFALVNYRAIIALKITDSYIGFTLKELQFTASTRLRPKRKTSLDEIMLLQLPVRRRKRFGDWLNVTWDDQVAVNVLAADPYSRVDAIPCSDYLRLRAAAVDEVQMLDVSVALITTAPAHLLDRIAALENDFNLPHGAESRRRKEYRSSYYELDEVTPENIDRHVTYARQGGFRSIDLYYRAFSKTSGHFDWRPEYPNGMEDLKGVVAKISAADILPGIHIHYDKADKADEYVSPNPDPRLNLSHLFTLAAPVSASDTTLTVFENPRRCTLENGRRFLKIRSELIEFENYTTTPPYQFTGCKRGAMGSQTGEYVTGEIFGQLDIDDWPLFVRFTQNTNIQQETAERLGKIYREAGFRWIYFDGAEDVPAPYWFTVSWAQWMVYKVCTPESLYGEASCNSHFSWHIATRGNAWDTFKPEVQKEAVRVYLAEDGERNVNDFTAVNFGWVGYWAPSDDSEGSQPDILEYVTSTAAAWDCPISFVGELKALDDHPRTPDNLEVLKRWEDVRVQDWLIHAQKEQLRNLKQEHTLLVNEQGKFELVPYDQIANAAGGSQAVRAFVFQRQNRVCVVYWHPTGEAKLDVPLPQHQVRLMKEFGKPLEVESAGKGVRLPLAGRAYLECTGLTRAAVIAAFEKATVQTA